MGTPFNILPQGFNQATAAMQAVAMGNRPTRRAGGSRKRRKASKRASASGRRTRRAKKPARLVKGSRAAKAWMARIRRKRR